MLNELVVAAHQNSVNKRWWTHYGAGAPYEMHNQTFLESMALVMTECAEAIEHFRHGNEVNQLIFTYEWADMQGSPVIERRIHDGKEQVREWVENDSATEWLDLTPNLAAKLGMRVKPDGVPSELADIIIRVFDVCGAWSVDLDQVLAMKIAYNATRPERHGKKRA